MDATVDVNGTLRGSPAKLAVDFQGAQQPTQEPVWLLKNADIRLGDNHINAMIKIDQALAGQVNIDLPRLVQLWPGLAGKASGEIKLAGSLDEPLAVAQLQGNGITYDGQRVGKLTLQGKLLPKQRADFTFDAERIWSAKQKSVRCILMGKAALSRTVVSCH